MQITHPTLGLTVALSGLLLLNQPALAACTSAQIDKLLDRGFSRSEIMELCGSGNASGMHGNGSGFTEPAIPSQDTEEVLWDVMGDLQRGRPNYDEMEPALARAVREQLPMVRQYFRLLGDPLSVTLIGSQLGKDTYRVRHEGGESTWQISMSSTGRINVLWFQM